MPEEQTEQAVEQTDEDFDWGQFFANDETPAPVAETPPGVEAVYVDESVDDLRAQLKQAQADSAKALEIATQARTQGTMQTAILAWKQQATPPELALSELLMESATPEDLKRNAEFVKKAALKMDSELQERIKTKEKEMQVEFGMPVPPTFQPMPEKEKVKQLLADGELADAAATMMKGF